MKSFSCDVRPRCVHYTIARLGSLHARDVFQEWSKDRGGCATLRILVVLSHSSLELANLLSACCCAGHRSRCDQHLHQPREACEVPAAHDLSQPCAAPAHVCCCRLRLYRSDLCQDPGGRCCTHAPGAVTRQGPPIQVLRSQKFPKTASLAVKLFVSVPCAAETLFLDVNDNIWLWPST